jgi:hypothetical protein
VIPEVQLALWRSLRDRDVLIVGERPDLRAEQDERGQEDEGEAAERDELRAPGDAREITAPVRRRARERLRA